MLKNLKIKSEKAAEKIMKEAADRLLSSCKSEQGNECTSCCKTGWHMAKNEDIHGVVYLLSGDMGEVLDYWVGTFVEFADSLYIP